MDVDVFTLFPQWFDWYRTQRHITNVLALGHALRARMANLGSRS